MKKKLRKLAPEKLREIARQFSIDEPTHEGNVEKLAEYLLSYGLTYADLACRFQLLNV